MEVFQGKTTYLAAVWQQLTVLNHFLANVIVSFIQHNIIGIHSFWNISVHLGHIYLSLEVKHTELKNYEAAM